MLNGKLTRRMLAIAVMAAVIIPAAASVAQAKDPADLVTDTYFKGTIKSSATPANVGQSIVITTFKVRAGAIKLQSNKTMMRDTTDTTAKMDGAKVVPGDGSMAKFTIDTGVTPWTLSYTDPSGQVFEGAKIG